MRVAVYVCESVCLAVYVCESVCVAVYVCEPVCVAASGGAQSERFHVHS